MRYIDHRKQSLTRKSNNSFFNLRVSPFLKSITIDGILMHYILKELEY